jgi:hypothetical protein
MEAVTAKTFGTALGMGGDILGGMAEEKSAKRDAAQMVRNAKARYAEGTRAAGETQRQGQRMLSDARAAMAAGGGTTTDAGAIEQQAKIQQATDYNALASLFEAETESDAMKYGAAVKRYEGKAAKRAGFMSALKKATSLIPVT